MLDNILDTLHFSKGLHLQLIIDKTLDYKDYLKYFFL